MEIPALTAEMITVFAILGMVIILLVFDVLLVGSAKLRELFGSEVGKGIEFVIQKDFPAQTLDQLDLRAKHRAPVVAVAKDNGQNKIFAPTKTTIIEPGDSTWPGL